MSDTTMAQRGLPSPEELASVPHKGDDADEIERLRLAQGWQPIASAPKDGTWFLAHGDGPAVSQCPFVCVWDFDGHGKTAWREVYTELVMLPTHWQPLPEPPQ